jgi:ubiquinone/menaquinone biosynthesis C-methylase UbiE
MGTKNTTVGPASEHEQIARQLRKPSGEQAREVGLLMNKANETLYRLLLQSLGLAENDSVLEIGFGNGMFFDQVLAAARNLRVTGIDYSPEMVAEATAANQARLASGELNLHTGSSDDLPFPDQSFDKVFCSNVIYFWDNPHLHLQQVHRVLKPGGGFFAGIRSKDTLALFPFTQYGFTLYEEEEWRDVVQKNGFTYLRTDEQTDEISIEGENFRLRSLCLVAEK